ncbi:MAG: BamA/TamA family outer membrane protein [Verrucomicrobiota bacterium]
MGSAVPRRFTLAPAGGGRLQGVKFQNYFGIGSQTLNPLSFPGSPLTYTRYSDYYDAINKVQNGQTWSRYNSYYRQQAFGGITLERSCDGGLLRPLIGFQLSRIKVTDYTGDIINGAVEQPTLLYTDYQNGSITGFNGGWDNALKLGLTYDTRDFEPDPTQGVVLMLCSRIVGTWIGSTYDYEQLTLSARYFYNLLERPRRLIFAVRGLYSMEFGNIPFYSYPDMPFTDGDVDGLGGWNTLRGYKQNRFVGHDAAVLNGELRWTFGEANFVGQHLSFMLAPFVDSGCVFNSIAQSTFKDWKVDAGLGFRLAWNLSTVVSFDYAISSERAVQHAAWAAVLDRRWGETPSSPRREDWWINGSMDKWEDWREPTQQSKYPFIQQSHGPSQGSTARPTWKELRAER